MLIFRGTREELVEKLRLLAAQLSGAAPDTDGLAAAVLTRGATALLGQIQDAFLVKARGGTDAAGIKWAPLQRKTIAARRTNPGELRALGAAGKRVRGLLTPAEDKRWRAIFASNMARLRARGIDGREAMALAAQRAWAALKASGAKTKLAVLGGRTVEIGRDTGRLLQSLTPGYVEGSGTPAHVEDQIFAVRPGRIAVGTTVEYARRFHEGDPARNLPARPLWSEHGLPDAWWEAVNGAILRGMMKAVEQVVQRT